MVREDCPCQTDRLEHWLEDVDYQAKKYHQISVV